MRPQATTSRPKGERHRGGVVGAGGGGAGGGGGGGGPRDGGYAARGRAVWVALAVVLGGGTGWDGGLDVAVAWGDSMPTGSAIETIGPDTPVATLIAELDEPSHARRERATDLLMRRRVASVDELVAWLREARTPEQRRRLMRVADHQVHAIAVRELIDLDPPDEDGQGGLMDPGGGIGIVHRPRTVNLTAATPAPGIGPGINPDVEVGPILDIDHELGPEPAPRAIAADERDATAVLILYTHPGFPGHAWLRPGDLVLAVDDRAFGKDFPVGGFQEIVVAHQPGEQITLRLLRDGQVMDVSFPLADARALQRRQLDAVSARADRMWRDLMMRLDSEAAGGRD